MRRVTLPSVILVSALLGACAKKDAPAPAPPAAPEAAAATTIETTTFAPVLEVNLAASSKTESGVYYRDIAPGAGAPVTNGQVLSMRYTGWLPDGTRFDGNEGNGPGYTFPLGARKVIDGWDHGVLGMKVGGKRQLIIPPALGYGATGSGPIPPNAVLVFTVELLSAQ